MSHSLFRTPGAYAYAVAIAFGLVACGGPQAFSTTYKDNRPADVAQVTQRLNGVRRSAMLPVAVGASHDNQTVFAYDLSAARMLWTLPASPVSAPLIAGDYVVVHETGRLRVLRLRDGQAVVDRPDEHLALMGADGDGALAAIVMSSGGSMGARSKLWMLRDGQIHTELEAHYALGAPAVLGDLVFLPWNNVHLSVLQSDGQEIARLRVYDDVISRAFSEDNAVYFGQLGLFRFGADIAAGDKPATSYFHPKERPLPGNPAFLQPANRPPPPVQSALNSVRLAFEPALHEGKLGLSHDHLYLLFYRQLFALGANETRADWVYEHPEDVVGLTTTQAGLLLADAKGGITLVDHEGQPRFEASLGLSPAVVAFRADSFAPTLNAPAAPVPLADQFAAAAMNVDARLVPSRAMSVEMLGALPSADATRHLIALCEDAGNPPRVQKSACLTLSQRSEGAAAVRVALERHDNFLTGSVAPPVGALAEAAMHMQATDAVPALLAHLRDPATPAEDLPQVMLALKQLADGSVAEPVHAFLMLYHADEDDPNLVRALDTAMEILAEQRGAEAAPSLELIANDPLGLPPLRDTASRLLSTLPEPAPDSEDEPLDDGQAVDDATADGAQPPEDAAEADSPPAHLTARHVERALKQVMQPLRQCLRKAPKRPQSARLTIVVGGEGDILLVRTLPSDLLPCIEPLVRSARFPANKHARRQQITYRLKL